MYYKNTKKFRKEIILIYLLLFILFIILAIPIFYAGIFGAPPVPTPYRVVRKMLKIAEIKPGEILYDLGAGDGRIVIMATKNFKAKTYGFEMVFFVWFLSQINLFFSGVFKKTKIYYRNFYNQNLSEACVITCFLTPGAMGRLKPKLEKELKPETKIVSYAFSIPGWKPEKIVKVDEKTSPIYLYIVH